MDKYKSKIVYDFCWQNGNPQELANKSIGVNEKAGWLLHDTLTYVETVPFDGMCTVIVLTFRKYVKE